MPTYPILLKPNDLNLPLYNSDYLILGEPIETIILTATTILISAVTEWTSYFTGTALIECIGAGGAGSFSGTRSGGGGGAYSAGFININSGQTYNVSIGPNTAGNAYPTWFGSETLIYAEGGNRGFDGGTGGQSSYGYGPIRYSGGNGKSSGGGGGAAGRNGNGGDSTSGDGGLGNGLYSGNGGDYGFGFPGEEYGGGGGGSSAFSGGFGYSGVVIITRYKTYE